MNESSANPGPTPPGRPLQAWLVLVLALCFGALLAGVHLSLGPAIAANKTRETLSQVPLLVPDTLPAVSEGADAPPEEVTRSTVTVARDGRDVVYPLLRVQRRGRLAGWVVKTGGQGYAGRIELLVGLDAAADTITGLFVLAQKETPGLGNKIVEASWRRQFAGQATRRPLVLDKGGKETGSRIDAITGATISSRAVVRTVNAMVSDVRTNLPAPPPPSGKGKP